jgi:hypothetical protein
MTSNVIWISIFNAHFTKKVFPFGTARSISYCLIRYRQKDFLLYDLVQPEAFRFVLFGTARSISYCLVRYSQKHFVSSCSVQPEAFLYRFIRYRQKHFLLSDLVQPEAFIFVLFGTSTSISYRLVRYSQKHFLLSYSVQPEAFLIFLICTVRSISYRRRVVTHDQGGGGCVVYRRIRIDCLGREMCQQWCVVMLRNKVMV